MTEKNKEVHEKEVIVSNGSGGAGWFVAVVLVAVILVGGYVFRDTILGNGSDDVNITVDVPGTE